MVRIVLILLLSGIALSLSAQEVLMAGDTIRHTDDSLKVMKGGKVITAESYAKRYQPRKAILYAAVLPGMGQIYNKKYWKLPIVYGGFIVLTSFAIAYNNLFEKYKNELFIMIDDPSLPTSPSGFTKDQLRSVIDTYRRQRDYFVILDGFMYILQLVDAHVDAHLKEFDLNPQLKVSIKPTVQQNYLSGRTSGITLTIKF